MKHIQKFEGVSDRTTYYAKDEIYINRYKNDRLTMEVKTGYREDIICGIARIIAQNITIPLDIKYEYTISQEFDDNREEEEYLGGDLEDVDWLKALIILVPSFKTLLVQAPTDEMGYKYDLDIKKIATSCKNLQQLKNKMEILKKRMDIEIPKFLNISKFDL